MTVVNGATRRGASGLATPRGMSSLGWLVRSQKHENSCGKLKCGRRMSNGCNAGDPTRQRPPPRGVELRVAARGNPRGAR